MMDPFTKGLENKTCTHIWRLLLLRHHVSYINWMVCPRISLAKYKAQKVFFSVLQWWFWEKKSFFPFSHLWGPTDITDSFFNLIRLLGNKVWTYLCPFLWLRNVRFCGWLLLKSLKAGKVSSKGTLRWIPSFQSVQVSWQSTSSGP